MKLVRRPRRNEAYCVAFAVTGSWYSVHCACADSVRLFAIKRTSTRRFLARPEALVFCATGLSLPNPIRNILCAGTLYFCARY